MAPLPPIELGDAEKLELLRQLDRYRKWRSLDDKRYCLTCGRIIDGHGILIVGGMRGTEPLRLVCPSRGCQAIPIDWVIPNDKVLARMSMLEEEPESAPPKAGPRQREKLRTRLRRLAGQFGRAA